MVTAGHNAGMPFAIVVNLEDFSVRSRRSADTNCGLIIEPVCVRACDLQGAVVLAADSEEEQVQWMEMLQDSGKV